MKSFYTEYLILYSQATFDSVSPHSIVRHVSSETLPSPYDIRPFLGNEILISNSTSESAPPSELNQLQHRACIVYPITQHLFILPSLLSGPASVADFLCSSLMDPVDPLFSRVALGCWPPEGLDGVPEGLNGAPEDFKGVPEGFGGVPDSLDVVTEDLDEVPEVFDVVPEGLG